MSVGASDAAELLEIARAAVRAAQELLATARPHEIRGKGNPRDLVTEWDLRTEELIREVLAERAPGIPVLGEEGGADSAPARGLRWLVDPIDGTVNFAHGLPIWSIAIAAEEIDASGAWRGTLAGVVAAPALGWWFEAARGSGSRDAHGPLGVSDVAQLEHALLVTGFPYDRATNPLNNFAEWEHLQRTAGACRRLGAASLDLCCVARGWLDGYWERHLKAWDTAAGALIAREAGATVTDIAGGPFDPHGGTVVASNGAIHARLVEELGRCRPA